MGILLFILAVGVVLAWLDRGRRMEARSHDLEAQVNTLALRLAALEDHGLLLARAAPVLAGSQGATSDRRPPQRWSGPLPPPPARSEAGPEVPLGPDPEPKGPGVAGARPRPPEPWALEEASPEDDLVELPTRALAAYTEKASPAELAFAGHYLNLAGLLVLGLGAASLLKLTWSGGLLQCLAGLFLGGFLVAAGDRFHRQGLARYSHPMLAAGFALLLLTACAAHFYFGLVGRGVLFASVAVLVAAAGLAAVRYDSRAIADLMLGVLFLGPFFMTFRLDAVGTVIAYLLAVSVGTTWVAFHKKWDFQLIAAFLGSYALFFYHFQFRHPAETMAFLAATYALFLAANHLNHFVRRSSSDYNLVLSFVNPIAFAAVSYFVLLRLPNAVALVTYPALGAVHLALAALARRRARTDGSFQDLVTANLNMGLLFLSASVSFLTYCSTSTSWFSAVTLLWFGQAFVLQAASRQFPDLGLILRRYGYLGLLLAGAQLAVVIPTMEDTSTYVLSERLLLNLASAGLFFAWFLLVRSGRPGTAEERGAMRLAALASLAMVAWLALTPPDPVVTPVAAAALALALPALGFRFALDLAMLRLPAVLLAVGAGVGACLGTSLAADGAVLVLLLAARGLLASREDELPLLERSMPALLENLAGAVLLRGAFLAGGEWGLPAAAGMAAAMAAAPLASWRLLAQLASLGTAAATLLGEAPPPEALALAAAFLSVAAAGLVAFRDRLPEEERYAAVVWTLSAAAALGRLAWDAWAVDPGVALVAGAALAMTLGRLSRREGLEALGPAAWLAAALTALGALAVPLDTTSPAALAGLALACLLLAGASGADRPGWPVAAGLAALGLLKLLVLAASGPWATLLWALAGLALFARRPDLGGPVLFAAFLKSVALDGNFASGKEGLFLAPPSGALEVGPALASLGVPACLLAAAWWARSRVEVRNGLILMALVGFVFRSAQLLYEVFGVLDQFQVILSAFWGASAFLFITWGIHREVKVFRLFGLTILVAAAVKIGVVDLWVLNAYSKTTTLLILGSLLMAVSFLYQSNRGRLEAVPQPA